MQKFAEHGGVDGNFHIRIVENHRGRIAAELEQHSFEDRALRRQLHDPPADFGRAGEGNHPRHRMAHEGIADHAAGADDDIEHAGGNPRFFVNLRQQRAAGHRRVRSRLDHHRVAHGDRRGDRAAAQMKRKIPRADHADHAHRLPVDAALLGRNIDGQDRPFDARRKGRRFEGHSAGILPFDVCFDPRAARFGDQPIDDLVTALVHDRGGAPDDD